VVLLLVDLLDDGVGGLGAAAADVDLGRSEAGEGDGGCGA